MAFAQILPLVMRIRWSLSLIFLDFKREFGIRIALEYYLALAFLNCNLSAYFLGTRPNLGAHNCLTIYLPNWGAGF